MDSGQCSTYLSWGPSKLLQKYIYIYVICRKHGYWSHHSSCLNCPPFVLYMLALFTSIYHQQLHQTSHKAICFSDIRLENVLKNSHGESRVRRQVGQDKPRWSKMVGSTSLNGISWFLVPNCWTCSHNMFMCAWERHSCDVWRYRCFEAYEWYDPWNCSILWLALSQPANKFHMQMIQPQFVKRDSACLFPKSYKNLQTSMASGNDSYSSSTHAACCVIHFRSPSSSQIAKSPRNRSQLRLYIKQHFKKNIKKYIFSAKAPPFCLSPKSKKTNKSESYFAEMFQMIL